MDPELSSNRIILYAGNGMTSSSTSSSILFGGSEGDKLVLLSNMTTSQQHHQSSSQAHHYDHQLLAASSESDHYYCKSSDMDSSPLSKNEHSDSGYHPLQWAEGVQAVQLGSSPDRNMSFHSRADSPLSPSRSSPIFFSPPPRASVLTKRYDSYEHSVHSQYNRNESFTTPILSSSDSYSGSNSNAKRGRPSQEEISTLIVSGSSSKSAIKCDVCNRVFPREKSLQAHLRTHTGERPYKCTYQDCARAFAQSGQLRTHQRLHTGEKPFACRAVGCQNRFTHPNRKCNLHPSEGLRRIVSAVTSSVTVAKKSVENKMTTPRTSLRSTNNINSGSSLRNPSTTTATAVVLMAASTPKPVLGNITSAVINSPKKTAPGQSSSAVVSGGNRQTPIVARKSVIVGGRTSRKLELELDAVATSQSPSLFTSPPKSNKTNVITSTNSENVSQTQANGQSPERNRSDILGALALMELAGVFNNNATNQAVSHVRSPIKRELKEEDNENRAPTIRGSPKKLRFALSTMNN